MRLRGIDTYDPQGNGGEHGATAPLATDGNPATYWRTETYDSPAFGNLKQGVGLVLDAGRSLKLIRLTVTTDAPGFQAVVRASDSSSGGFQDDSPSETVSATTTFALDRREARYYLLWITRLPPGDCAHINEVTGSS